MAFAATPGVGRGALALAASRVRIPRWLGELAPSKDRLAAGSALQQRVRLPAPPAGWGARWTLASEQARYRWFAVHVLPTFDSVREVAAEYRRWRTTLRALLSLVASRPVGAWRLASRRYLAGVSTQVFPVLDVEPSQGPEGAAVALLETYGLVGVRALVGATPASQLIRALQGAP